MTPEVERQAGEAQQRRARAAGAGDHVVNGRTVLGVRLSVENLWRVDEWAEGKPYYDPAGPGEECPLLRVTGMLKVTGYSVFTPAGKIKAEFGDLIYVEHGRFFVHRGEPTESAVCS